MDKNSILKMNDLVPDDEIIGMVEKSYELVNQ